MNEHYNVLFLCTGNSARSILAEAILNHKGRPRFHAFSAGSHPTGLVNPEAIRMLRQAGLPTEQLRSKSWDEFSGPDTPVIDFVITVCDNAAREVCPIWPGRPVTGHWGVPDPAAVHGNEEEVRRAFQAAYDKLERRIDLLLNLPLTSLDPSAIKREISRIGEQ